MKASIEEMHSEYVYSQNKVVIERHFKEHFQHCDPVVEFYDYSDEYVKNQPRVKLILGYFVTLTADILQLFTDECSGSFQHDLSLHFISMTHLTLGCSFTFIEKPELRQLQISENNDLASHDIHEYKEKQII